METTEVKEAEAPKSYRLAAEPGVFFAKQENQPVDEPAPNQGG